MYYHYTGYSYAGLQATAWCTCGDSFGKHGLVADSQCNHTCPGGPGKCGAGWRNSISKTETPAGRYLGCFKDTDLRDLPYLLITAIRILSRLASDPALQQVLYD